MLEAYSWVGWFAANVDLVVTLALVTPLVLTQIAVRFVRKASSRPDMDGLSGSRPDEEMDTSLSDTTGGSIASALPNRLIHTRDILVRGLESLVGSRRIDESIIEEFENLLFAADLGVNTAQSLLDEVRRDAIGGDVSTVREVLKRGLLERLLRVQPDTSNFNTLQNAPHVVLVLGVNGVGKTTTIGKLAAQHRMSGRSVVLGAGDTFRAAAVAQLEAWASRADCKIVKGSEGADPASVAFDTVRTAKSQNIDVALIDTAGRLQTKIPLMEELAKIVRVIGRGIEGAPHETLLVLDANTGQNAISQARLFTEVADISGIVLAKLDGTARGGVIVGLADEFGIPIRYIGVGEGVEDLREFQAVEFVDALFESPES